MTRRRTLLTLTLALLALGVAACGSGATSAQPTVPPTSTPTTAPSNPTPTTPATHPAKGSGWIDGEPEWSGPVTEAAATTAAGGGGGDVLADGAGPASTRVASGTASPRAASGSATAAPPGMPVPHEDGPLHAGSVDDNADFARYLEYLDRYRQLGLPDRPFDPTGRIVVHVTGPDGLPVMGRQVTISAAGQDVATLMTSATGRVIFLPSLYGTAQPGYHVATDGAQADAAPGTDVTLAVSGTAPPATIPVDVLFLLDVTGSMGDEITQLKTTIDQVAAQLAALPQQPDLHLAMTLFRDEGDSFVTSTFDFTADVAAFRSALADVVADGGGDTPEAVEEGLAAALGEPSWRDPATTVQMIFLVGDAAPHTERQLDQPWTSSVQEAARRGITINSIAASNTDDTAEHAFRGIAEAGGGKFVFLSYGAGGAAVGANTDITKADYEEMSLDQLVVRLVSEELAALTGSTVPAPPTTVDSTPPTNPPGQ